MNRQANIVGLTLAVNLWGGQPVGGEVPRGATMNRQTNIVGLTLAVNLWVVRCRAAQP